MRDWLILCIKRFPTATIEKADVTGGTVRGIVDNGVAAFKGIPFAAPPVGDLRWQAPQPVIPWSGVKQTSAFALPCAQGSGAAAESSEDCLYLNIWTSATSDGEKRPVHPELRQESGKSSGAYGLEDQIAALQWLSAIFIASAAIQSASRSLANLRVVWQ
jgi:carboxylesterase type B